MAYAIGDDFLLIYFSFCFVQVGSLSLSKDTDGSPMLVVSQPGCNYAELKCSWVMQQGAEEDNPEDQR